MNINVWAEIVLCTTEWRVESLIYERNSVSKQTIVVSHSARVISLE